MTLSHVWKKLGDFEDNGLHAETSSATRAVRPLPGRKVASFVGPYTLVVVGLESVAEEIIGVPINDDVIREQATVCLSDPRKDDLMKCDLPSSRSPNCRFRFGRSHRSIRMTFSKP